MSTAADRTVRVSHFPTTAWSIVAKAGSHECELSPDALARFCSSYWQPVYIFIRSKGFSPDEARDCTQEFFTRVIEKDYLRDVDQSKGRFRSFLLAAVGHLLSNRRDALRAQKRGGGIEAVPLQFGDMEACGIPEPAVGATPEQQFEYRWAFTVIDRALDRLRGDYAPGDFRRLKAFLEIGQTVADPGQVDEEIRYLMLVLARGSPRG